MPSDAEKALLVGQVARALEGPFIGSRLARPEWASDRVLTDAIPVFTLACFGGPFELTDDFRPQLRVRMEAVRSRLEALAPRLKDVSDAELKKWLYEHGKTREVWGREGERLEEAARLLFQLKSDHPSKGKEELRKEINLLWKKEGEQSRWFKLNRQEFICEKFATWLIEDEQSLLAGAQSQAADKPERQPTPPKEQSAPEIQQRSSPTTEKQRAGQRDDEKPPKQPEPDRQEREKPSPASQAKGPPPSRPSKKAVAIVGGVVILSMAAIAAFLGKDSARIFGESLRTSTAPAAALECGSGKTEDFAVSPPRFPGDPELVDPASLSVSVGRVTFWFESLTHRDRPVGFDSWDFVFTPRDTADNLTFIFRSDIGSGGGFGYVIEGPPGAGLEPENEVCRLIDFHKTDLGVFLKDQSDDEGLEWASSARTR